MRILITLGATIVIAGLVGMGVAFGVGSVAKDSTTPSASQVSAGSPAGAGTGTGSGSGSSQALFPSLDSTSGFSAAYGTR